MVDIYPFPRQKVKHLLTIFLSNILSMAKIFVYLRMRTKYELSLDAPVE